MTGEYRETVEYREGYAYASDRAKNGYDTFVVWSSANPYKDIEQRFRWRNGAEDARNDWNDRRRRVIDR